LVGGLIGLQLLQGEVEPILKPKVSIERQAVYLSGQEGKLEKQ